MAEVYPQGVSLTEDEQRIIREAKQLDDLLLTPGWTLIDSFMQEMVDIAQARSDACASSSDKVIANLQRNARERKVVLSTVRQYIASTRTERTKLLESISEKMQREAEFYEFSGRNTDDSNPLLDTSDAND